MRRIDGDSSLPNYISGFIILLDRSVTIGDLVTVDKHTGQLVKMSARYIVVRGLDGTEAIIPNETVITSTVVNQSYTDRNVRVGTANLQSDLYREIWREFRANGVEIPYPQREIRVLRRIADAHEHPTVPDPAAT